MNTMNTMKDLAEILSHLKQAKLLAVDNGMDETAQKINAAAQIAAMDAAKKYMKSEDAENAD